MGAGAWARCDRGADLRALAIVAPEVRDDDPERPVEVFLGASGALLRATFTPPGGVATTEGAALAEEPPPSLAAADRTLPGCWLWRRAPGVLLHVEPGARLGDGVVTREAIDRWWGLHDREIDLVGALAPPPRTPWTPDRLVVSASISLPEKHQGARFGEDAFAMLVATCGADWAPGGALAVRGSFTVLWCPTARADQRFLELAARQDVTRVGDHLEHPGPFGVVARLPDGLVHASSAASLEGLGTGEPWWPGPPEGTAAILRAGGLGVVLKSAPGADPVPFRAELTPGAPLPVWPSEEALRTLHPRPDATEQGGGAGALQCGSVPPSHAIRTPSGLVYEVLAPGTGTEHPTATSRVKVHYTGWTADGRQFDTTATRGRPVTLPLGAVIAGWNEGLQTMTAGGKTRFWIPADLAYGDEPSRPGVPVGRVCYDVELLEIVAPPAAPGAAN